jgi:hypothetical protein
MIAEPQRPRGVPRRGQQQSSAAATVQRCCYPVTPNDSNGSDAAVLAAATVQRCRSRRSPSNCNGSALSFAALACNCNGSALLSRADRQARPQPDPNSIVGPAML